MHVVNVEVNVKRNSNRSQQRLLCEEFLRFCEAEPIHTRERLKPFSACLCRQPKAAEWRIKMFFVISIIIGILLLVAGMMDLKSKSISRGFIFILMLVCLIGAFAKNNFGIWDAVGGILIGLCAVGLSMASREQIGRGDGLVIAAIGLALGFRQCLFLVCIASVIMALVSVGVLIFRKGNRDTRLPFVPALFAAYAVCMTVGI